MPSKEWSLENSTCSGYGVKLAIKKWFTLSTLSLAYLDNDSIFQTITSKVGVILDSLDWTTWKCCYSTFVLFEKKRQFNIVQLIIGSETNIKCFHWNSYILGCPKKFVWVFPCHLIEKSKWIFLANPIISFYLIDLSLVTKYLAIDNFEKIKKEKLSIIAAPRDDLC